MNDNASHASRQLADYLVGKPVPKPALDQACRDLNTTPDDVEAFRRALSSEPMHLSAACFQFQANAAEFCDMPGRVRNREMPDLVAHVFRCDHCRRLFQIVKHDRMWEKTVAAASAAVSLAQTSIKNLTARVRFTLDSVSGMLVWDQESEWMFGEPRAAVASTMGRPAGDAVADAPTPALRVGWSVTDDETGYTFRFRGQGKPRTDRTIIELEILDPGQHPIDHNLIGIEVTREETGDIHMSCPLDLLDEAPLELGPGQWAIEIRCGDPPNKHRWMFHFEFQAQASA